MPKQVSRIDEFKQLLGEASECRVVRRGDRVKVKLRTPRLLYTYVTSEKEAEELLKDVKIPIKEFLEKPSKS